MSILELDPILFYVSGLTMNIDFWYLLTPRLEILIPVFTDVRVKNINHDIYRR